MIEPSIASAKGASENGGLTIGILPDESPCHASDYIHVPICTGMGSARNTINVLSSDVVVACPGGAGTLSEIALALKHGKPVITIGYNVSIHFISSKYADQLFEAVSAEAAVDMIKKHFAPDDDREPRPCEGRPLW